MATGRAGVGVAGSLTRAMVNGAVGLRPPRDRVGRSVRIAACMVVPLVVGLLTDHIVWGSAATYGAFVGFHGHKDPYLYRARLLAGIGAGFVLAVMVGTLAGSGSPVVLVGVTALFAGAAAFVCQALELPPPREFMHVMICLLIGSLPTLAPPLTLLALTIAGAAWGWLVLMSGWLFDREGPERQALRASLLAILDLLEQRPPVPSTTFHGAVLATRNARRAVERANGPTAPVLRDTQRRAEDLLDDALALALNAPSAPVSRLGAADAGRRAAAEEAQPDVRVLLRLRARELLGVTDQAARQRGFNRRSPVSCPQPTGLSPLRNALSRHSLVPPTALRMLLAVAVALTIGQLIGAPKGYWIAIAVAAVLQGQTLMLSARRAMERGVGTGVGVLLGGLVVVLHPGSAAIVLGILACMLIIELTVANSYVVGVTFITPMTLLMGEIAAPGTLTGHFVAWRLVDTLIGCVVGLAAMRLLWPQAARNRLDVALHRTLDAIARVVQDAAAGVAGGVRHELRVALLNLRAISDVGLGDRLTRAPEDDHHWPLVATVSELGYRALADRGPGAPELERELARLQGQVRERTARPTPPATVPSAA